MRLDKVDLNLFVVFDAIYRERSITRVAALLNLSQPAVSNALSRLRQTLDDPLFVRTPQGMAPTPVADHLVTDVRTALDLLNRSVATTSCFDPRSAAHTFRIGMNDLAQTLLLPRLQQCVQRAAPGVTLATSGAACELACEELKSGNLDLLLDLAPAGDGELCSEAVATLDYALGMRRGHPLAQRRALSLTDYLNYGHLQIAGSRRDPDPIDTRLQQLGHPRRISSRVQHSLLAEKILQQTDLLWTAPARLLQTLALQVRPLPFAAGALQWNLCWHRHADGDPANLWLRERVREVARAEQVALPPQD